MTWGQGSGEGRAHRVLLDLPLQKKLVDCGLN